MGIIKAVWKNENHSEIALVTSIGVIPFINEGDQNTQDLIDDFNSRSLKGHSLGGWSILDDYEKTEFHDVSDQYWL